MKKIAKVLIVVLAIAALLFRFSVTLINKADEKAFNNQTFIAFSNAEFDKAESDDLLLVSYEEIKNYESEYSDYNQYFYYNQLSSQSDKIVYKIYEYALDHSYTNVFIEDEILRGSKYNNFDIFEFLALDSPFVEQNYENYEYEATNYTFYDKSRLETDIFATVQGNIMQIEIFTEESLEKKEEALEKAEEIVDSLSEEMTDVEKATFFFNYLEENVEYVDYEETNQEANYLYDALIAGETNCDGYTNAFSLLCALEDIPCFEKVDLPPEADEGDEEGDDESENSETTNEEYEGHTWNTVKLNDKWYNVDATNSDFFFDANGEHRIYLYFGFSDEYEEYPHAHDELLPDCEENLFIPDCEFESFDDSGIVSQMKQAFFENDEKYIFIHVEEYTDSYDDVMQELANSLYRSIYHENYNGIFEDYYFIYPS